MQTKRRLAANPQTKPTNLTASPRKWQLPSASTIAIYYYSAIKLILILRSHVRVEGQVDLAGWLHTENKVPPPGVEHIITQKRTTASARQKIILNSCTYNFAKFLPTFINR